MATDKIAHIYKVTQGKIEIIGVGGVNSADTAWEKIAVGASAVQVVTAIRGEGPAVAGRINRGIVARLEREGFSNISEVVVFNSLTSSLTSPIIHLFFRGLVQVHIGGTLHDLQHAERTGETPVATVQSG